MAGFLRTRLGDRLGWSWQDDGPEKAMRTPVAGPTNSTRFKISVPAYAGYTYEVYGNPTLGPLAWSALAFSLSPAGTINTNKLTAGSKTLQTMKVRMRSGCVEMRTQW